MRTTKPYSVRITSWLLLLLAAMGSGMLVGCASTNSSRSADETLGSFPNHSVAEILALVPEYPKELQKVRIQAQIAVASPEMDGTFTAVADASHFDSLFVRIKFPLGIEGARVLITPDSAFTYDRIQNTVYRSSASKMKSILPGSVMGLDLVEQITGFVAIDPAIDWEIQTESSRYYLHSPDGTIRYTIDPTIWRIEHVQLRDLTGVVIEQRWYLDFSEKDGVLLPSRMIYVEPSSDTRLSISLQKMDKNPGRLHFDLGVRADTQWKDLTP
ncbi:DUF4292 domain-containing protein [bacterium]|nr:DUF4292 domain-containing protein [bacterium]